MTHQCCPPCRLRFTAAAGAYLVACPECGEPPQSSSLEGTVGFRIFRLEDVPLSLPEAVAVSLPIPEPDGGRA
jgi:hypothetical protein